MVSKVNADRIIIFGNMLQYPLRPARVTSVLFSLRSWRHGDVERAAGGSGWDDGGGAAGLQQMALHPRTVRKHAVPPLRSRARPRALLPTASRQPDPGHGTEIKRVSFRKTVALWLELAVSILARCRFWSREKMWGIKYDVLRVKITRFYTIVVVNRL